MSSYYTHSDLATRNLFLFTTPETAKQGPKIGDQANVQVTYIFHHHLNVLDHPYEKQKLLLEHCLTKNKRHYMEIYY